MPTRILTVADDRADAVDEAARALRDGRLVVLPTDTVYGVAADAFSPTGTRRVFGAKRRPRRFPLPVLVRNPKQLAGICPDIPVAAERLMSAYWPGPLTIVVRVQPDLAWDLGENRGTVAVRMPLDDTTLDVIRAVGPLAVTSANRSGEPAATTAAAAHEQLGELVEVYVDDGERSDTSPSTIVDLTRGEAIVLREGPLSSQDVLAVARGELDPIEASARALDDHGGGEDPDDDTTPAAHADGGALDSADHGIAERAEDTLSQRAGGATPERTQGATTPAAAEGARPASTVGESDGPSSDDDEGTRGGS